MKRANKSEKLFKLTIKCLRFIHNLKREVRQHRKRETLLKQWISIVVSNHQETHIITTIIKPEIQNAMILSSQDFQELFVHFDAIQSFQLQHKATIMKYYQSLRAKHKSMGKEIEALCCAFHIYENYFKTHLIKENILKSMYQNHSKEMEYIDCTVKMKVKLVSHPKQYMITQDYFQKVLFRGFKINILLKEYIKYLSKESTDYDHFVRGEHNLQQLNKKLNEIVKNSKKQQKKIIIEKHIRKGIESDYVMSINAHLLQERVQLNLFSNVLIIIKEKPTITLHEQIWFDEYSRYKILSDMGYYRNILLILGANAITHIFFDKLSDLTLFAWHLDQIFDEIQSQVFFNQDNTVCTKRIVHQNHQNTSIYNGLKPIFDITISSAHFKGEKYVYNENQVYTANFQLISYQSQGNKMKDMLNQSFHASFRQSDLYSLRPKCKHLNQSHDISIDLLRKISYIVEKQYDSLNIKFNEYCPTYSELQLKGNPPQLRQQYRKLQIQLYLNTIFRNKDVLISPIWLIKMLKISPQIFQAGLLQQQKKESKQKIFQLEPTEHCKNCENILQIQSISELQGLRDRYLNQKINSVYSHNIYCNNLVDLVRVQIISLCSNSLHEKLWMHFYLQGRIDYAFVKKRSKQELKTKYIQINQLGEYSDKPFYECQINAETRFGEVMDKICFYNRVAHLHQFKLIAQTADDQQIFLRNEDYVMEMCQLYKIMMHSNKKSQGLSLLSNLKEIGNQILSFGNPAKIYLKRILIFPYKQYTILNQKYEMEFKVNWIYDEICAKMKYGKVKIMETDLYEFMSLFYMRNVLKQSLDVDELHQQILNLCTPASMYEIDRQLDFRKMNSPFSNHCKHYINCDQQEIEERIISLASEYPFFTTYIKLFKVKMLPYLEYAYEYIKIGVNYQELFLIDNFTENIKIRMNLNDVTCYEFAGYLHIKHDDKEYVFKAQRLQDFVWIIKEYQYFLNA